MKKRAMLLIVGLCLCCLTILAGCDNITSSLKETLPFPEDVIVNYDAKEVTWAQVDYATGGYKIEVTGPKYNVVKNVKDYWYSLDGLETGTYSVRVKALTIDKNYYKNSEWSQPVAYHAEKESGIIYRLINNGSEYEVERIGTAKGTVNIFKTYNNKPITSIGAYAFSGTGSSNITNVIIGENVTNIGYAAFYNCSRLIGVTFPAGLKTISDNAFRECRVLENVTLPEGLTYLGAHSFQGCRAFSEVTIPKSILRISDYAFGDCLNLSKITMGDGVLTVGGYAFYNTPKLKTVTIPDNVQKLEPCAFLSSGITDITIGSGVSNIGMGTFAHCVYLQDITIPTTVKIIGMDVFFNTALWNSKPYGIIYADNWVVGFKAEPVYGEDGKQLVEDKKPVFNYDGFKHVDIREGTVGISDYAFYGVKTLKTVTIPDSVNNVGSYTFLETALWDEIIFGVIYADKWVVGCISKIQVDTGIDDDGNEYPIYEYLAGFDLRHDTVGISGYAFLNCEELVTIGSLGNVKSIGESAFYKCYYLEVSVSSKVKYIGPYAFYACGSITSVVLPTEMTYIAEHAFQSCYNITSITIPSTVTHINDYALAYTGILNLTIPDSVVHIGDFGLAGLSSTTVTIPDTVKYLGDFVFYASSLVEIIIPESITRLGDYAFANCSHLRDIIIPNTVTSIGAYAFDHCYFLQSIVIPDSVTSIGQNAFACCYALTDITLSKNLTRISKYMFFECTSLPNIVIPESVTSIAEYAFVRCYALKTVVLGNNMLGIGAHAFFYCGQVTFYSELPWRGEEWSEHWKSVPSYGVDSQGNVINDPQRPTFWSCVLSDDKEYVVSIEVHEDNILNPDGVLFGAPYRKGYVFIGWTKVEGGLDSEYDASSAEYAPQGTVLYAIWAEM